MSARPLFSTPSETLAPPAPGGGPAAESSIGDLAREFGVTLRTLRFYEHRGLLKPRREGMARFYDETEKARLALILKGKQLGFTLTEIRAMVAADGGGDLTLTRDQILAQLDQLRDERTRIEAGIAELESKLARA